MPDLLTHYPSQSFDTFLTCCRSGTRTPIDGTKIRSPTIRRTGNVYKIHLRIQMYTSEIITRAIVYFKYIKSLFYYSISSLPFSFLFFMI